MQITSVFKQINVSNAKEIKFEKDELIISGNLMIKVITRSNDDFVSNFVDLYMELDMELDPCTSLSVDIQSTEVKLLDIEQGNIVIYPQQTFGTFTYEREALYVYEE